MIPDDIMFHMELALSEKWNNKKVGSMGEKITAKYYQDQGFSILGFNYLRKWGEIDVIAEKAGKIYFIEVKTVSYGTKLALDQAIANKIWRPEERVDDFKLKKLSRVIDTWLKDKKWTGDWQIDVAAVRIVPRETYATIKIIPNVILD